jgi:hypothetical protein
MSAKKSLQPTRRAKAALSGELRHDGERRSLARFAGRGRFSSPQRLGRAGSRARVVLGTELTP